MTFTHVLSLAASYPTLVVMCCYFSCFRIIYIVIYEYIYIFKFIGLITELVSVVVVIFLPICRVYSEKECVL